MPRRLKLSPLQRDITLMLEEACAETIGTVIATVKPADAAEFDRSIDGLIKAGISWEGRNTTWRTRISVKAQLLHCAPS